MFRVCKVCSSSKIELNDLLERLFDKEGKLNSKYIGGSVGDTELDHEPVRKICKCDSKCLVCGKEGIKWDSFYRLCDECEKDDYQIKKVIRALDKIFWWIKKFDKQKDLLLEQFEGQERELVEKLMRLWEEGI